MQRVDKTENCASLHLGKGASLQEDNLVTLFNFFPCHLFFPVRSTTENKPRANSLSPSVFPVLGKKWNKKYAH